jgi:hypothetical protein
VTGSSGTIVLHDQSSLAGWPSGQPLATTGDSTSADRSEGFTSPSSSSSSSAEAARSVVDGESRGGRSTHLLSRAQYLRSRALLRNIIVVGEASAPELVKTYLEVNKVTFDVATFDGGHF